jgi:hypothetical protein
VRETAYGVCQPIRHLGGQTAAQSLLVQLMHLWWQQIYRTVVFFPMEALEQLALTSTEGPACTTNLHQNPSGMTHRDPY